MNKKFYGTLLLGTLLLGSTIVSCKDYDDDIDNLQNQITQLATKADMQSEVSKLQSAVATAQAAAENKAAAAEQAAKDAAAKAQAAADAAAKAQGTADAAATVEALNKVAADAAAAAKAAEDAKAAAEAKAAELEAQLAELQALAATLVSTTDFEAAKKELNDKYAELAAKIGETTGVTGMTGINLVGDNKIAAGYGVWAGVRDNMQAAEWDGPKAETINAIEKGTKLAAWGAKDFTFSVNPTDFDASKIEAFAVVNQFDEVAPIAFGNPKAVTRAAAGAWTLPVLGNAIYGEKAAEFEKNFSVDENNANGTMATLVAGQFAGALKAEFCKVEKNENKDKSSFDTKVAYDKIDGVVELNVDKPQYVFDAYIVKLAGSMEESSVAHDSIVYKLAYTGTTLTYDAATVKKLVAAKGEKKLKVTVKQINLNGYIHTADYEITFEAKKAPEHIKAETVLVKKVDHQIAVNYINKSTGEMTDLQKQTADLSEALTDWGIDLSKKDAESTIHWMHTTGINDTEATVGDVYYYKADETKEFITGLIETATLKKDGTTGKLSVEFEFVEDYKYDEWDAKTNDAAWKGEKVFVELSFTGTDTDATESTDTDYKVIVPIQFNQIDATQYYNWNAKKRQSAPGKIDWEITSLPFKDDDAKINQHFQATVEGATIALVAAKHTEVKEGTTVTGFTPGVTITGHKNAAFYQKEKERIAALVVGATIDSNDENYDVNDPQDHKVSKQYKKDVQAAFDAEYNNLVLINQTGGFFSYYQYIKNSTTGSYSESVYLADNKNGHAVPGDATTLPDRTKAVYLYIPSTYAGDTKDSFLNNEYTVSGLKVQIAGREVNAPLSVKLSYGGGSSATGTSFTTSVKMPNVAGESITLWNSEYTPLRSFGDGSFTLKDGNDVLQIKKDATGLKIYTAELVSGSIPSAITGTNDLNDPGVISYDYADGSATGAIKLTLKRALAPGAEKKLAVKLTIPANQLTVVGTNTALSGSDKEFKFVLEFE